MLACNMRTKSTPSRLPLLASMTRDITERGALRRSTAVAMWAAYTAHAASTVWALVRSDRRLPGPDTPCRAVGATAAISGTTLCFLGMRRFTGIGELEGTQNQRLTTNGIYRWSRNPQYLGYLLLLGGSALARRSLTALTLAGLVGVAYQRWIPVEERQLTALHGRPYIAYLARTHRWWGRGREDSPRPTTLEAC